MAEDVVVVPVVVLPGESPNSRARLSGLRGREPPGVPSSWVTRVAVVTQSTRMPAASAARPSGASGTGEGRFTVDELGHERDLDLGIADPTDT